MWARVKYLVAEAVDIIGSLLVIVWGAALFGFLFWVAAKVLALVWVVVV
jgi:hypothetical protein